MELEAPSAPSSPSATAREHLMRDRSSTRQRGLRDCQQRFHLARHMAPPCAILPPSCMTFETLTREHGLRDGPRRQHFARSMAPSCAAVLAVCIWMGTRRADIVCAMAMGSLRSRAVRPPRAADSLLWEFSWKFNAPTWNLSSPMQCFSAHVASCQVRFAERRAFVKKAQFPLTPSHPSICSSGLRALLAKARRA